jgi:hypothetical protein
VRQRFLRVHVNFKLKPTDPRDYQPVDEHNPDRDKQQEK